MIELSKYRVIDLSYTLLPGEQKIDGHYLHGEPFFGRWIEVQEFIAYGARMHFIQSQTHNGTHAEVGYKYSETGQDFETMPVECYMGEAVVCKFTDKRAGGPITVADLQKFNIKAGDIVLAWAPKLDKPPYMTVEAIDWLIEKKIKMFCNENLLYSPPGTPAGQGDADCKLLLAGVTMVDAVVGIDKLTKPRVFFIALPAKMKRITASWVRAIALEEI
jgi:kynurenine formamidase